MGAARDLPIPKPDADGRFTTINSNIGKQEAVWHLRAAMNVAALSCGNDAAIVGSYNRLLTDRKAVLKTAYASETQRFGAGSMAADRHMTQLYNYFAQPPAQAGFCRAASAEAARIGAVSPAEFADYAVAALARLEAPIIAFYQAYDGYRIRLADWKASPRQQYASSSTMAMAPRLGGSPAAGTSAWRIQIGAFTGRQAAEGAWRQALKRVPSFAGYQPHYETVPGPAGLVRVQLGPASGRDGAVALCAAAAVGGFDCLPVSD